MPWEWFPGSGYWYSDASEIVAEQVSEERAHPLMMSDQPPQWSPAWPDWRIGASTVLKEQAFEDEAQKIASSEVLSY